MTPRHSATRCGPGARPRTSSSCLPDAVSVVLPASTPRAAREPEAPPRHLGRPSHEVAYRYTSLSATPAVSRGGGTGTWHANVNQLVSKRRSLQIATDRRRLTQPVTRARRARRARSRSPAGCGGVSTRSAPPRHGPELQRVKAPGAIGRSSKRDSDPPRPRTAGSGRASCRAHRARVLTGRGVGGLATGLAPTRPCASRACTSRLP